MEQAIPGRLRGWWQICRDNPYSSIFAVLAVFLAIPMCLRRQGDWFEVYVPAAAKLWGGEALYPNDFDFVYPPLSAFLAGAFLGLPPLIGRVVWYAVNVAALGFLLRGAWQLSGGARLQGTRHVSAREHGIAILGLLCGIFFAFDALTNRQTDLLLAALVIGGCQLLHRGKDWSAALMFGLAAAVKCTPLLWAAYLAWRRRWLAGLMVVAAAAGFNLAPDLMVPPPQPAWRLMGWAEHYLVGLAGKDAEVGVWKGSSATNYNHSLAGVGNRLVLLHPTWPGAKMVITPRSSRPGPTVLKALVYGTGLMFVFVAVLASWREPVAPARETVHESNPLLAQRAQSSISLLVRWIQDGNPLLARRALEFSLVCLLMLLLSPMSSKAHFCTLLLPGFCLARLAFERRDGVLGVLLSAAIVAGVLSNKDLLGERAYDFVIWYGSVFWATVLLFAGCCYALWRGSPCTVRESAASVRAATVSEQLRVSIPAASTRAAEATFLRAGNVSDGLDRPPLPLPARTVVSGQ